MARQYPVVAMLGPRQSGKTTLVKHVFPKKPYASLEDLDTRDYAINDPRGFLSKYSSGAIFDEVQRAPQLFSYLQTIVDNRDKPGLYVLTGSNNFLLQENLSQTLAGRVSLLNLLPFSITELKNSSFPLRNLEHRIFEGFYPRVITKRLSPSEWHANYIQTYLEREVRMIKNVSDIHSFQKFLKLCAGRTGQILNLSVLGSEAGITHNTAKSWISILESSYIIFLLQPYFRNFNKRITKMPKLYFYDTALACSLLGIENHEQLSTHYARGALFESFVISELMKHQLHSGSLSHLYYFRDQSGNEIDCVIEKGNRLLAIEIKASKTIASDFFKGLLFWQKLTSSDSKTSYILYGGEGNQKREQAQIFDWKHIDQIFI